MSKNESKPGHFFLGRCEESKFLSNRAKNLHFGSMDNAKASRTVRSSSKGEAIDKHPSKGIG